MADRLRKSLVAVRTERLAIEAINCGQAETEQALCSDELSGLFQRLSETLKQVEANVERSVDDTIADARRLCSAAAEDRKSAQLRGAEAAARLMEAAS